MKTHLPFTVWGLALAQALLTTGNTLLVAVSALIGSQLASHPALVTAPIAAQFLGLIMATLPAAHFMQKYGRKKGFIAGNILGLIGALVAMQGLFDSSLALFALGTFLTGLAIGTSQQYRFAALDECPKALHAKAIGLVMGGGVLAAVLGPNMAIWSQQWYSGNAFVGAFFGLFGLYFLALVLIILLPLQVAKKQGVAVAPAAPRSYGVLFRQPVLLAAVASGIIGYAVMVFLMTATPLAMQHDDFLFEDIAIVIQWHVLGMFVPSFFTGHLIKRFGIKSVVQAGCVLLLAAAGINLLGQTYHHYFMALMLLGVGWNFTFIGATNLLSFAYQDHEKGKVQGMNDFLVFTAAAFGSLFAGQAVTSLGWVWVNLISIPFVIVVMLLMMRLNFKAVTQ
ncbi:MAG: MFS transporter [Neisseriaceae bacterium]|nr:MFS transporter [Neisseriaceae bacterium]